MSENFNMQQMMINLVNDIDENVEVFVCNNCDYEDSSFIPSGAKPVNCKKKVDKNHVECPKCHHIVEKNIITQKYEPYMSLEEFNKLYEYIMNNHSFSAVKGKMIKYITPTIDTRSNRIYQIKLDDKVFSKVNENRHKNLYDWIMEYLDN